MSSFFGNRECSCLYIESMFRIFIFCMDLVMFFQIYKTGEKTKVWVDFLFCTSYNFCVFRKMNDKKQRRRQYAGKELLSEPGWCEPVSVFPAEDPF